MPLYFAYGSNMSTARLRARVSSANPLSTAAFELHQLRFHKRSKDGSGKANALATDRQLDIVEGVLFELTDTDLGRLDQIEGPLYARILRVVRISVGGEAKAWVYVAKPEAIDSSLKPFDWYLRHILDGAREHRLSPEYIAALERTSTQPGEGPREVR